MRGSLVRLGLLACLAFVLSGTAPSAQVVLRRPSAPPVAQPASTPVANVGVGSITVGDAGGLPVFERDFPDPSVIRVGTRYYAFATETPWETGRHVFPILVSEDLADWTYVSDVFTAPPTWGRGDWWAPAVIARDGAFFLYYSGLNLSGVHCLAVATASEPTGPYTDHGPIACQDGPHAIGYIDASPLVAGGRGYLYFSVDGPDHHSISALPLTADMLHVAGPRVELLDVTQSWEKVGHGTVEGPSVFAWGSSYVMLYSGGDWRGQYGMGYAVATAPLGPFVKSAPPMLTAGGSLAGPGGGSFFTDRKGRPWLAYHGWRDGGRELYISPLSISA